MTKLATHIEGPVAVIGDVYGYVDKLADVLEKLRTLPDYEQRWIIFIGDFVDRGSDGCSGLGHRTLAYAPENNRHCRRSRICDGISFGTGTLSRIHQLEIGLGDTLRLGNHFCILSGCNG